MSLQFTDVTDSTMSRVVNGINMRIDNVTQQGSVLDVIKAITGQQSRDCSKTLVRLFTGNEELEAKCLQVQINGKGRLTWIAPADVLIQIVWELPGRAAKEFRRECAGYICRVLGGDPTLVREMELRATHISEEQRAFFLANVNTPDIDALEEKERILVKRKRVYTELAEKEEKVKKMRIENMISMVTFMTEDEMDERDRINVLDLKRRFMVELTRPIDGSNLLESGNSHKEISIPMISQKYHLKYRSETASSIGKLVANLYRRRHSKNPPKREAIFGGRPIMENAYFEEDEDLVKYAIMTFSTKCDELELDRLGATLAPLLKKPQRGFT